MPRRLPFSAHVFLYRQRPEQAREYVLFLRHPRPELTLPAFWQGVSGALESGESFAAAARREVQEETGLILEHVSDVGFAQYYPIREAWRDAYGPTPTQVQEQVFCARIAPDAQPVLSGEHQHYQWLTLDEALPLLDFCDNRACLMAAATWLDQQVT
ncbi:8-oxo-dGTP pyrophosphatase MutT (NUDIX family) [Silvimonas terrae]|uniref:8-oxo-dGTP pyrophosphatase MutT (NUDIX family) n=1 Tax=Silvimonas terrae TaxID=300266 RepID=A0A840REH2_9NEIS|nr:NUDIX domain-containing protein [Silvimonas terrae]MBB5191397.1 8-oxo-dGTP pyrophosphatase MutT (NUDIX family) [Silvimonas terrae]